MTNSRFAASELSKFVCSKQHRHIHLTGGRAADAAVYPDALCVAICRAISAQLKYDATLKSINSVSRKDYVHNDEYENMEDIYEGCEFDDDVSGGDLDKELVRKARRLEIDFC